MRVLVVEDDIELNTTICQYLEIRSFETLSSTDGAEALNVIEDSSADLYIIDINLPEINGLDLLTHIRKTDLHTPIIIITASLEIQNFTQAYEEGCNEYIKKPFHLKELDIRMRKLLAVKETTYIKLENGLEYDPNKEEFIYHNKAIVLRPKEKRLCSLLIKNINEVVTNETIENYVWKGEIREVYPLRQLLLNLRKKLPYDLIHNRARVGYFINSSKNEKVYRVS